MEAPPARRSPGRESKIERGWRLTQVAWRLIREDRAMLALALLGIASTCFFSGIVFYLGGYFSDPGHTGARFGLVALLALYPSVFASVFFNVALASAASAAFDGEHMTVGEALRNAYGKRGRIATWALIAASVGLILSWLESRVPLFGRIAVWLLGAAWGLATMFVIPILAMEGSGAVDSLRRSTKLAKSRWGEGVTGNLAIGAWAVVVALPLAALLGAGGAVSNRHPAAGLPIVAASLVGLFTLGAAVAATTQVFGVALYRTSIGAPTSGFTEGDVAYPFVDDPARRKRKSWILRIGGVILALFAVLIVIALIVGPRRHPVDESAFQVEYTPSQAAGLSAGSPVYLQHRLVGEVISAEVDGAQVRVSFDTAPSLRQEVEANPAYVDRSRGTAYIRIGARPSGPGARGTNRP